MKIRKIRFKNINSLRGEHEIDFTKKPLSESRLFAITGPTGSGKSTILDVIALALFNQVPRLGRISNTIIEQGGAILTRNTDEAFASVEFECTKGIFRSTWSISTNRNQKLRPYDMELTDVETNKNIDINRSHVPAKNEELIGLSYDQFIKSIMLAQGEFAKFLKVNKSERGELLEKITGTSIYRALGKKAFEKKGQYASILAELRKEEAIYKGQLLEDEELKDCTQKNKELTFLVTKGTKEVKQIESQIELRVNVKKVEGTVSKKLIEIKEKEDALDAFNNEHGKRLKTHEATAPFVEKLEEWKNINKNIDDANKIKENLRAQLEKQHSKQTSILDEVKKVLQKEVDSAEVKEKLQEFQSQIETMEHQIEAKKQDYKSKHGVLVAKSEPFGFTPDINDPESDLQKINSLKSSTVEELREVRNDLDGISLDNTDDEIIRLDNNLNALRNGKEWIKQLNKVDKNIALEQDLLASKLELEKSLPTQIESIKKDKVISETSLKNLRLELDNQKLRASFEDLRAKLEDGNPCQLCGSTEHPWATHMPLVNDELENLIEKSDENVKSLIKDLNSKEELLKNTEKDKQDLQNRLQNLNTEKDELTGKLTSECGQWFKEETFDWEEAIINTEKVKESINQFTILNKKLDGINGCIPILEKMLVLLNQVRDKNNQKNALFSGSNIRETCESLRESWSSINQSIHHSTEQQVSNEKEINTSLKTKAALDQELTQPLKQAGFNGIEDAILKRLREAEYQELNNTLNGYARQVSEGKAGLKTLQKSLSELKEKLTEEDEEELTAEHENLKAKLIEFQEALEEVKRKIKNHQDTIQKIESILERIVQEEKTGRKWELLNQLIGDATGKKFNDFAQDLTLQRLLVLANQRLSQLIDRYQIASPLPDEDDGLVVIDNHMGAQRRSVKTLSGGETFILSLSLALALSDLAARNVEINSLFIDEGFGTLDPETLDQTIDTLEKLQTESSKTIGIISHVEALKERIDTQIQLERNGQGYSSLKVG